jgi:hypothetical protein
MATQRKIKSDWDYEEARAPTSSSPQTSSAANTDG